MPRIRPWRNFTLIALLVGSLLAIIIARGNTNRLQEYKGKNAQYWFERLVSESPTECKQAEAAFEAWGANCNGFLLSQVTANVPTPLERTRTWVEEKVLRQAKFSECGLGESSKAYLRQECLKRAYGILQYRGEPAMRRLGSLLSNPLCQHDAAVSLVAMGPVALPEIQKGLNSKDVETRKAMVSALGGAETNTDIVCDLLIRALQDPDGLVRHYAAYALGELEVRPERSIPVLVVALKDPDPRVRYITIFALEKFGSNAAPAVRAVRQLQNDPEENVRKSALEIADKLENRQ